MCCPVSYVIAWPAACQLLVWFMIVCLQASIVTIRRDTRTHATARPAQVGPTHCYVSGYVLSLTVGWAGRLPFCLNSFNSMGLFQGSWVGIWACSTTDKVALRRPTFLLYLDICSDWSHSRWRIFLVVTSTLLASDTFNQNQLFNTDYWITGHTSKSVKALYNRKWILDIYVFSFISLD